MADLSDQFIAFLKEYGILGLAIAVVIGNATTDLVSAVVADLIMPIVEVVLPGSTWQTAELVVGPFAFKIGHLTGALIDFTIIALLVFAFFKLVMKKDAVEKP